MNQTTLDLCGRRNGSVYDLKEVISKEIGGGSGLLIKYESGLSLCCRNHFGKI